MTWEEIEAAHKRHGLKWIGETAEPVATAILKLEKHINELEDALESERKLHRREEKQLRITLMGKNARVKALQDSVANLSRLVYLPPPTDDVP